MEQQLRDYLYEQWRERVNTKYMFRGMSSDDLKDPLDPSVDPFKEIRSKMHRLIGILQGLVDAGFQFKVYEDYSGLSFDLRDIVEWTRRDLDNPGFDFTSSHESASGYARNFQGSQLKQNFKYIMENLPGRKDDPMVQSAMAEGDWKLVLEVNQWVSRKSPTHRAVVIWVRRSCPAFESDETEWLPLGSFAYFCDKALARMEGEGLSHTVESARQVLARERGEFSLTLVRPLRLADVERVEEVGNQTQES